MHATASYNALLHFCLLLFGSVKHLQCKNCKNVPAYSDLDGTAVISFIVAEKEAIQT